MNNRRELDNHGGAPVSDEAVRRLMIFIYGDAAGPAARTFLRESETTASSSATMTVPRGGAGIEGNSCAARSVANTDQQWPPFTGAKVDHSSVPIFPDVFSSHVAADRNGDPLRSLGRKHAHAFEQNGCTAPPPVELSGKGGNPQFRSQAAAAVLIFALVGSVVYWTVRDRLGSARLPLSNAFVSAVGSDANNCVRQAPCRTLTTAIVNTKAGGHISILDPASYDTLIIDKSMTIEYAGAGSAAILVSAGTTGITINAGSDDSVHLRGLTIEGAGVGSTGIRFNSGKVLTVQDCLVRNLADDAIALLPTNESTFTISNTHVSGNGGSGLYLHSSGSMAKVEAVFNRIQVQNNGGNGLLVESAVDSTNYARVEDSIASNNGDTGFYVASLNSNGSILQLIGSVSASNNIGITAQNRSAVLQVFNSTVTGNEAGWVSRTGGVVESYANNKIDGNASSETAPPKVAKNTFLDTQSEN